ncbi:MAG: type II secretion system F family protein [bacterium]
MVNFLYKIVTPENKVKTGVIPASSKRKAIKALSQDSSVIVFVSREKPLFWQKQFSFSFSGFSAGEKIGFFRDLSMMYAAGVSLIETIEILSEQSRNKWTKKTLDVMAEDIRNGQRLSKAMGRFPKYFPRYLMEIVNMGELSGKLSNTVERISQDLEKDNELRKKIIGAMIYPAVIICVMTVVIIVLMTVVLPEIVRLFQELKTPLPLPTKILLGVISFITLRPLLLIGSVIGIILLFVLILKTKKGRYLIHSLILRIPVFGGLMKDYNLALFFRSLEALYISGISLDQAVEIASNTTKNDVYKNALNRIRPILVHGVTFSDALLPLSFLFPKQIQKIVSVGERAGKMEETFKRITSFYEAAVDYKARAMTVLIEPILMIIIAAVVAWLAFSLFLPIYQIVNVI